MEQLRQRFEELGDVARQFFEGLVQSPSQVRNQAKKTLALLSLYHRRDVLAAMERAVRYRAFSWKSLERILAVRARPKTGAESDTQFAERDGRRTSRPTRTDTHDTGFAYRRDRRGRE